MKDSDYLCFALSTRYLSIYDIHLFLRTSKLLSTSLPCMVYEANVPISSEKYFAEFLKIKVDEATTPCYAFHDIRIISRFYPNISVLTLYDQKSSPCNDVEVMVDYLSGLPNLSEVILRGLKIDATYDFLNEDDSQNNSFNLMPMREGKYQSTELIHNNPSMLSKVQRIHLIKVSIPSNKVFKFLINSCPDLKELTIEMAMHVDINRILFLFRQHHLEKLIIESCCITRTPIELRLLLGARLNTLKVTNSPHFKLWSTQPSTSTLIPTSSSAPSSSIQASTNLQYCDFSNTAVVEHALELLITCSPMLRVLMASFCRYLDHTLIVRSSSLEVLDIRASNLKQLLIITPSLRTLRLTLSLKLTELSIQSSVLTVSYTHLTLPTIYSV